MDQFVAFMRLSNSCKDPELGLSKSQGLNQAPDPGHVRASKRETFWLIRSASLCAHLRGTGRWQPCLPGAGLQ